MRSTGSSSMHMAAATAIRKGTKLKACVNNKNVLAPGAVVLYLSSAPCQWHWHAHGLPCSGAAKPTLQKNSSPDMMTRCNQPQTCCTSSAGRTLLVTCRCSCRCSCRYST